MIIVTNWSKTIAFGQEIDLDIQPSDIWTSLTQATISKIEIFEASLPTISLDQFGLIGNSLLKWFESNNPLNKQNKQKFLLILESLTNYWIKRLHIEFHVSSEEERNILLEGVDQMISLSQHLQEVLASFSNVINKFSEAKNSLLFPDTDSE